MTTAELTETVATYVQFWNAEEDDQRKIAAELFTDDVEYRSLVGFFSGVDPLVQFRTQFIENVGDAHLRARRAVEHHHDRARLAWEIVLADGTSFAEGTDILAVTPDGRVRDISAFLDRAPDGFDEHHHDDPAR